MRHEHTNLKMTYISYLKAILVARLYMMPQEERKVSWEVTVSVILSKKVYMYMCPISLNRRATRLVLARAARCIHADGGIFENVLYWVNCTNFATRTINTGIRNST